jgi:hypothetical protein
MPQICDIGPIIFLPFRRKACWGFFIALKNPTASAGFENANFGIRGQHATSAPPKPLTPRHTCHTYSDCHSPNIVQSAWHSSVWPDVVRMLCETPGGDSDKEQDNYNSKPNRGGENVRNSLRAWDGLTTWNKPAKFLREIRNDMFCFNNFFYYKWKPSKHHVGLTILQNLLIC